MIPYCDFNIVFPHSSGHPTHPAIGPTFSYKSPKKYNYVHRLCLYMFTKFLGKCAILPMCPTPKVAYNCVIGPKWLYIACPLCLSDRYKMCTAYRNILCVQEIDINRLVGGEPPKTS